MITESLDKLVHKVGGPVALAKAMKEQGVDLTHSAILYWYRSKNVHPKKDSYKKALIAVAKKENLKLNLEY